MGVFFWKLVRFGLVGGVGVAVDLGLTYLLKEDLHVDPYMASGIGFIAASTGNFVLNKYWTFTNQSNSLLRQYMVYLSIALVGLAINQGMLYIAYNHFQVEFYHAKVLATLAVVGWNFTLNYMITFR